jgi:hypothetical protein
VTLRNNTLTGSLESLATPSARFSRLDLTKNQFKYPQALTVCWATLCVALASLRCVFLHRLTRSASSAQVISAIRDTCEDGRDCIGLPPQSCLAYGLNGLNNYVVRSDDPTQCVQCIDKLYAILALCGLMVAFAAMLISYAIMMLKYPSALKQWVSTFSIIICHLQTVSIVSSLRLAWPQSAEKVFAVLIVNGFNLDAARPECSACSI